VKVFIGSLKNIEDVYEILVSEKDYLNLHCEYLNVLAKQIKVVD